MKKTILILAISIFCFTTIFSQGIKTSQDPIMRHSIETSPITPLGNVYSIQYNYKIQPKSELILGLAFVNIEYENVGNNSAPSLILGFRKYLWKKLHVQYELWPGVDNFYESNENKHYKDFQVWNEFRIGYQFDFTIKSNAFYTSLQWPLGFYLYKGDKPDSFIEYEEENRFFYDVPLLYVGMRF